MSWHGGDCGQLRRGVHSSHMNIHWVLFLTGYRSWTKVWMQLVYQALYSNFGLSCSEWISEAEGNSYFWAWLWSRYSHLKNGEVKVWWLAQGHYDELYYWINYLLSLCERIIYSHPLLCDSVVSTYRRNELSCSVDVRCGHVIPISQCNWAAMIYCISK